VDMRKRATVGAVMSGIGIASNQRVFLSIIVRMCANPPSGGSGPTRSMWRMSNLEPVGNEVMGGLMYRDTLWFWHPVHSDTHFFMSLKSAYQVTFCLRRW